jgi:hypothetical protein
MFCIHLFNNLHNISRDPLQVALGYVHSTLQIYTWVCFFNILQTFRKLVHGSVQFLKTREPVCKLATYSVCLNTS